MTPLFAFLVGCSTVSSSYHYTLGTEKPHSKVSPFFGCEKCREFKSNNFGEGVGYLAPDQRQSEVNGMGTTLYQASATAKELSAAHQNAQIDQTYSATCGFTLDLVKVAWLKMGVVTREVQILPTLGVPNWPIWMQTAILKVELDI